MFLGYYLATAAEDAVVKLWDLRKLKNFKTIQLDDKYEVRSLCFDQSGSYLAVAGTDVRYVLFIKFLFQQQQFGFFLPLHYNILIHQEQSVLIRMMCLHITNI